MTALLTNVPIPLTDPIARPRDWKRYPNPRDKDPNEGLMSQPWADYELNQGRVVEAAAVRINTVSLTEQAASIGATDVSGGNAGAGLYRLAYYTRVTTAATTSSSLTVTAGWTDGGISISQAGTALTGNTTSTYQTGSFLLYSDGASPITYATTYASVGATAMAYKLSVTLERMGA